MQHNSTHPTSGCFAMYLFIRTTLVLIQAMSNHRAFMPPNKTPEKGRYHTEEPYILQIAPSIFKLQNVLLWCIATFEFLDVLDHCFGATFSSSLSAHLDTTICPVPRSHMVTPLFVMGVFMSVMGTLIRIQCFRELGQFFTFDLSILPGHKLVTSGCYGYVRHPSYTGSMLIVTGIALSHLTSGSLAVDCSVLGPVGSLLLCVVWWMWVFSVGVSRAIAEDKELQKLFGPEWDAYAATVRFWFVPGLY